MNRLPNHRFTPDIQLAMQVTARFHRYTGIPHFLCGVDPVFVGLHRYETTDAGGNYRDVAHCVYPMHQAHMPADRRRTTIVLPTVKPHWVIVHEYGHALHEALRFEPTAEPITRYAQTDRLEAFAEALTGYLYERDRYSYGRAVDTQTRALLDRL